jgi:Mn-dependent DtxR family transcriptional regulator
MGLVREDGVELTAEGTSAALVLTSRRNAARDLTREVLGLEPEEAGLEAEQLASTASPALGRKLVAWRASRS